MIFQLHTCISFAVWKDISCGQFGIQYFLCSQESDINISITNSSNVPLRLIEFNYLTKIHLVVVELCFICLWCLHAVLYFCLSCILDFGGERNLCLSRILWRISCYLRTTPFIGSRTCERFLCCFCGGCL